MTADGSSAHAAHSTTAAIQAAARREAAALGAKILDHAERPATLVTLGDYVDRGPDSRRVVEGLIGGLDDEGWRLICLKGNHEDIMWQTCRGIVPDCDWWLTNGGGATLISYGQHIGDEADVTVIPDEALEVDGATAVDARR